MERKASSLRFTRGRLAALLLAVVLVTIVVFSLTFYHLCLHAKRMEVLTQGDGPLWAFEQGQLDILSQEADGATVYGGSGCRAEKVSCSSEDVSIKSGNSSGKKKLLKTVLNDTKGYPCPACSFVDDIPELISYKSLNLYLVSLLIFYLL